MDVQSLAARFHADGFVVAPQVFSPDDIAEMDCKLKAFIARETPTMETGDIFYEAGGSAIKSMFRLNKRDDYFDALTRDERLAGMVEAIFPGEPMFVFSVSYFGKPAKDGTAAPPHQDNGFIALDPPFGLSYSIALDEHTLENGAMHCARGSHHQGLLAHHGSGVEGFSQSLVDPFDKEACPPIPCLMKPGDVTLHHFNTIHFSAGNQSNHSRRMITTVFRSERATRDEARYAAIQQERQRLHGRLAVEK